MKVLSIGSDRNLFKENSFVYKRAISYSKYIEEFYIVVFANKKHNLKNFEYNNLFIYQTNSFSRFFYILDSFILSFKILKKQKSLKDFVITCQDPFESGLVGLFLSVVFKLPLHIQIHTDFLSPYFKENFLNKIRVFISKFVIKRACLIRVVSERIAKSLNEKMYVSKDKIQVLPIVLEDKNLFLLSQKKDIYNPYNFDIKIIVVSRLEKEKRVGDILKAFQEVVFKNNKIGLFIIGSGNQKSVLENLVNKLNIKNNVVFLGQKSYGEIAYFMKNAHIFINASSYEGYGLSLVEAGLSGLAIISSDTGLYPELLVSEENSLIFKVGDIKSLSDKIERLVLDNSLREKISKKIFDDLSNFVLDEEEYVKRYIDGLNSCL